MTSVLVAPVNSSRWAQTLLRYRKVQARIATEDLGAVRFVRMVPRR